MINNKIKYLTPIIRYKHSLIYNAIIGVHSVIIKQTDKIDKNYITDKYCLKEEAEYVGLTLPSIVHLLGMAAYAENIRTWELLDEWFLNKIKYHTTDVLFCVNKYFPKDQLERLISNPCKYYTCLRHCIMDTYNNGFKEYYNMRMKETRGRMRLWKHQITPLTHILSTIVLYNLKLAIPHLYNDHIFLVPSPFVFPNSYIIKKSGSTDIILNSNANRRAIIKSLLHELIHYYIKCANCNMNNSDEEIYVYNILSKIITSNKFIRVCNQLKVYYR